MSVAENFLEKSLKLILGEKIEVLVNHRPAWLINPKTGNPLEYDFYIPSIKLAFEVQGQHHYNNFYQKYKDEIKKRLSDKQQIKLMTLNLVDLSPGKIKRLIKKYLTENYISFKLPYVSTDLELKLTKEFVSYKKTILDVYGRNECQTRIRDLEIGLEKSYLKSFLEKNSIFRVMHNGRLIVSQYLSFNGPRVKLKVGGRIIGYYWRDLKTISPDLLTAGL